VVGLPLTPAYIRPPDTGRAGVPATGSAGIVIEESALVMFRSNPTVKLLSCSARPVSCSRRKP
jgi:hypothetical protein